MKKNFFNPTPEFVDRLVQEINERFVIEIGCGTGDLLAELIDRGVKGIGIDPFVSLEKINKKVAGKVLQFDEKRVAKFIKDFNECGAESDFVFIVARPCHSGFPQEYLRYFGDDYQMIYIGFVKNLEVDFERETSNIKILDFPEHEDCNVVAVLDTKHDASKGYFEYSRQWDKVDEYVLKMKDTVPDELVNWFIENSLNHKEIDIKYKKAFEDVGLPKPNSSTSGGNWEEYEGMKLLSRDITHFRECEVDISTFMVGGGHFASSIKVEDEQFYGQRRKDELRLYRPWDKPEFRPEWAERRNGENLTWYGLRDNKRTITLENSFNWLKNSFLEFKEKYKEIGIDLVLTLGSGLRYEIDEIKGTDLEP